MTESRVEFLNKIVSNLPQSENNESLTLLRSYYLMRCKNITIRHGLPIKHFSRNIRCSRCCLEWTKKADVKVSFPRCKDNESSLQNFYASYLTNIHIINAKVRENRCLFRSYPKTIEAIAKIWLIKPVKLSTRQKQRMMTKKIKITNENKSNVKTSQFNQLEQTCSFCKHTTITNLIKPVNQSKTMKTYNTIIAKTASKEKAINIAKETASKQNKSKSDSKKIIETSKKNISNTNVYSNAFDVYSLKNKQNTLASTVKETPKIIKNNKKKKDKFAGLCQKAVLASAKTKPNKVDDTIKSKLSLFLKPSSG